MLQKAQANYNGDYNPSGLVKRAGVLGVRKVTIRV